MNATARRSITRQITAILGRVMQLPTDLLFRLLNGRAVQQMLELGQLVTVNTWLDQHGADETILDGHRSWCGRSVARSYREMYEHEPIKAWVRHRTTRRWIRAFVYVPNCPALADGARNYRRTAHLVPVAVFAA